MTATHRGISPKTLALVALLAILALLGPALITAWPAQHAVIRHGDDALAIRACVSQGNTLNYTSRREPGKWYFLCQLPDGTWGLQIAKKLGKIWQEVTSFVPGDGSWADAQNYVLRLAVRFKGPLP